MDGVEAEGGGEEHREHAAIEDLMPEQGANSERRQSIGDDDQVVPVSQQFGFPDACQLERAAAPLVKLKLLIK